MIEIEHVSKTFRSNGREARALRDVSLTIEKGDIFGIIGYSGAGKSTLIRCINHLEVPDEGRVLINGEAIGECSPAELQRKRRKIGMIFQHFNLLSSVNVFENIAAPLKNHTGLSAREVDERVSSLLQLTGLEDKRMAYPSQLSGGQKQRVAIARALSSNPDILLCDEATSALDPNTTQQILELIKRIQKQFGITVVLITHQMEVVKSVCNKVAVMEHGRVAECGDLVSVFANPKSGIAREFVAKSTCLQEAKAAAKERKRTLYQLRFIGEDANEPVIARLVKQFPVMVSILFGNLEHLAGVPFGNLIVDLEGGGAQVKQALSWLRGQNIFVEVIPYE